MPHIHIFLQQPVVNELLTKTITGYKVDQYASIEWLVAHIVKEAFRLHAGEELSDDQVVRYDMRITNSMPVDMSVNITVWYTPERAPYLEAIEREVAEKLAEWAPRLNIEVHLIVVGLPKVVDIGSSGSQDDTDPYGLKAEAELNTRASRSRVSGGMVHEIADGDADFRRAPRGG